MIWKTRKTGYDLSILMVSIVIFLSMGHRAVSQDSRPGNQPNVLIILADDLGYGDLSCYGASKVKTPNIDRIARTGMLFTDAHSPASVCSPSRYNLLTGRYAWRTWVQSSTVWANDPLLIEPERFTLADLFHQQGYTTACIGKWHLGFGEPGMKGWDDVLGPDYNQELRPGPLELGFDYFWGFPHVGQHPHFIIENHQVLGLEKDDPVSITPDPRKGFELDYLHRPRSGAASLGVEGGTKAMYDHEDLANMITGRAVSWIQDVSTDKPFFLYLAHRNIHGPMIPDPQFKGKSEIGKRGDFLLEFDHSIGQVLDALDQKGLTENTIILFASDNGGIARHEPTDYAEDHGHFVNGPLRGQKTSVYEGGNRVPFMISWPGTIPAGSKSVTLVALTDLLATFAEFFEVELSENSGEDSFSFLASLFNRESTQVHRTNMVNDSYIGLLSIRKDNWKLITGPGGGGIRSETLDLSGEPPVQLYNLTTDLKEQYNVYEEHPGMVKDLTKLLSEIKKQQRSAPVNRSLVDKE